MKWSYLLLSLTLLLLILTPESLSSRIRSTAASILIPGGGGHSSNGNIEANVVYRSPMTWSSTLWVDTGANSGIQKDSSVLWNGSLIGLIDQVGAKQARVRLVTDSGLTSSVRVIRGGEANRELLWHLECLEWALDGEEAQLSLEELRDEIDPHQETWHLAKGELCGSGEPLWRSSGTTLRGIGFNYDHADQYGPGRDLRTGNSFSNESPMPILKVGDLLVTTGMDGVFPPGIPVARVTHIDQLREGSYFFELKARPTAGNLHNLRRVTILPPTNFSFDHI